MPKSLFDALALRHPEITIQMTRIVAARAAQSQGFYRSLSGLEKSPGGMGDLRQDYANLRTIGILPINSQVPVLDFSHRLCKSLRKNGESCILLDHTTIATVLGRHSFSRIGRLKLSQWLSAQEEQYRLVLFVADGGVASDWTQHCLGQADFLYLVGLGDGDTSISDMESLLIGHKITARKELVLLHGGGRFVTPGSTQAWLKHRRWVHAHHHVQMPLPRLRETQRGRDEWDDPEGIDTWANWLLGWWGKGKKSIGPKATRPRSGREAMRGEARSRKNTLYTLTEQIRSIYVEAFGYSRVQVSPTTYTGTRGDFARLARRLSGKSIGLVLGGGGARGISHLGIIRALEEAGIPVDMIGGTSIGSFIGGLYARDSDHLACFPFAKLFASRVASTWRVLSDLTYPVAAWTTGMSSFFPFSLPFTPPHPRFFETLNRG